MMGRRVMYNIIIIVIIISDMYSIDPLYCHRYCSSRVHVVDYVRHLSVSGVILLCIARHLVVATADTIIIDDGGGGGVLVVYKR